MDNTNQKPTKAPQGFLQPDLIVAKKQLELITGSPDTPVTFAILRDRDNAGVFPQNLHGTLDQLKKKLILGNNAFGGIFVSINGTDLLGRKSENIIKIYALVVDEDDNLKREWLKPPTFRVKTSKDRNGHAWFLLKPGEPVSAFVPAQKRLALYYKSDLGVCILPQVCRLAGFYHTKREPFQSQLIIENEDARYTIAELMEGIPELPPVPVREASKALPKPEAETKFLNTLNLKNKTKDNAHRDAYNLLHMGFLDGLPGDWMVEQARTKLKKHRDYREGELEGIIIYLETTFEREEEESSPSTSKTGNSLTPLLDKPDTPEEDEIQTALNNLKNEGTPDRPQIQAPPGIPALLSDTKKILQEGIPLSTTDTGGDEPSQPNPRLLTLSQAVALRKKRLPFPTGLYHFDEFLGGGPSAGDFIVIGGAPGSAKTSAMATMVKNMTSANTAVFCLFFDEWFADVAAKVAANFGLKYTDTEDSTPEFLNSLEKEIAKHNGFLKFFDNESDLPIETVVNECVAELPKHRTPIFILDHLHIVHSEKTTGKEQEAQQIGLVMNAIKPFCHKGGIFIVLSEVTKVHLSPEAVRANPMGAFAGSRAIASRAGFAVVFVKIPNPEENKVLVEVVPAKSRKKKAQSDSGFMLELDVKTWKMTTKDSRIFRGQEEERIRKEEREKKEEKKAQDDLNVIDYIRNNTTDPKVGCSKKDMAEELKAEQNISEKRFDAAIYRLKKQKRIEIIEGEREKGGRGRSPVFVREVLIEQKEETKKGNGRDEVSFDSELEDSPSLPEAPPKVSEEEQRRRMGEQVKQIRERYGEKTDRGDMLEEARENTKDFKW